jgi:hypothetical protein
MWMSHTVLTDNQKELLRNSGVSVAAMDSVRITIMETFDSRGETLMRLIAGDTVVTFMGRKGMRSE